MSLEGYPHIPPFTYIDYHLVTYPHLPSRAIANVARQTAVSFAATRRSRSPYGGSLGCSLADRICPLPQWPRRDVLFIADRDSILTPSKPVQKLSFLSKSKSVTCDRFKITMSMDGNNNASASSDYRNFSYSYDKGRMSSKTFSKGHIHTTGTEMSRMME
jgi:hypothetical protein